MTTDAIVFRALNPFGKRVDVVEAAYLKAVEAENARLKAAMDKYSEVLIERCAKVCENQVEDFSKHRNADGVQNGPDMFADEIDALIDVAALIRALKVEPTQTIGGNDPEYLAEVFWRNKERRNTCLWTEMDEDTNNWDTSCGTAWTIVDGTPTSNEIKYCHGCGLLIKVADKPLHGADGRLIQRRKGERRVKQVRQYFTGNGNERSGKDRRKA